MTLENVEGSFYMWLMAHFTTRRDKLHGSLKVEYGVIPLLSNVAIIPDEAIAEAIFQMI